MSPSTITKDGKAYKFQTGTGDTVYIGDSKDAKFHPKLTLNRWLGECFLKFRFPDAAISASTVMEENKVKWQSAFFDFNFYPTNEGLGGLEFEIVLKQKPPSNAWAFPIETKGLKYYYQPELTPEEIAQGCVRPDNIVGSYAVYHATRSNIHASPEDAEKYKCGKAFHIYPPFLTDDSGKKAKGSINISDSVITFTFPQDFLDSAIYPVTVDPTFGYETQGSSLDALWDLNCLFGSLHTSPADADTADSISVCCKTLSGTYNFKGVIALHSTLNIISNGITDSTTFTDVKQFYTASFSTPPSLSPNTAYVLMAVGDYNGAKLFYDTGDADQGHEDTTNSYASPTNPTDATHNTDKFSIYCTYTAGGATYTKDFTVDAFLEKTYTKTLQADAYLEATKTKTFTVDGRLVNRYTKTFDVDAYLEAAKTKTFTVDAYLEQPYTKTFDIDAILQATQLKTFAVDAFLEAALGKSFTADAILKLTSTKTFNVDAFLRKVQTKTFTVDSILKGTYTKTYDIDAILSAPTTKTFSLNALLKATLTKTLTADAYLQKAQTKTLTADAYLEAVQTKTFVVDAYLEAAQAASFTLDAYLQATQTKTFTLDAILTSAVEYTKTFSVDAFLQATFTKTFTVDAVVGVVGGDSSLLIYYSKKRKRNDEELFGLVKQLLEASM